MDRRRELEDLLNARRDALRNKAIESGGDVDEAEWRAVERLSALVLAERPRSTSVNRRMVAALFLCTLVIVTLFLFIRVRTTDIEMEMGTGVAGFRLQKDVTLMHGWNVRSVGVSGLREMSFPHTTLLSPPPLRIDAAPAGAMTLAPLTLPAHTTVTISSNRGSSYRLTLLLPNDKVVPMTITARGSLTYSARGSAAVPLVFKAPKQLQMVAGAEAAVLDLALAGEVEPELAGMIPIEALSLADTSRIDAAPGSPSRSISSIVSGTIYYHDLDARERRLRRNEDLRLTGVKGVLQNVSLQPDGVALRYVGQVDELTTGTRADRHSLMPNWLEFLAAQRPVALLWGTAMYLFGLVLASVRWWKSGEN